MRDMNESYEVSKRLENLVWVNGTTDKRFDLKTRKFTLPISSMNGLCMTSDINYALNYSSSHTSKDYGNDDKKSTAYNNAWKFGSAIVVFILLKEGLNIFNLSKPLTADDDDYSLLDIPVKFRKIFEDCEPYYALNTNVKQNIDSRKIEYVAATKYFIWKMATLNKILGLSAKTIENKTLYTGQNTSFLKLLFSKHGDTFGFHADKEEYLKFYEHYFDNLMRNVDHDEAGNAIRNDKGHLQKTVIKRDSGEKSVQNALMPELPEPDKIDLDILNTYLEMFDYLLTYAKSLGLTTVEQVQTTNIANSIREALHLDYTPYVSENTDILQLLLQLKITDQDLFLGYYCPEYAGAKTMTEFKVKSDADTLVIFDKNCIQRYRAFSSSDIVAAKNELGDDSDPRKFVNALAKVVADKKAAKLKDDLKTLHFKKFVTAHGLKMYDVIVYYMQHYKYSGKAKKFLVAADSEDIAKNYVKQWAKIRGYDVGNTAALQVNDPVKAGFPYLYSGMTKDERAKQEQVFKKMYSAQLT